MIETRRLALDVRYNSYPFAGQVGGDIESLTYTDSAADNSDSIDITINAQDRKWLLGWMPEKGATLRARVFGYTGNGRASGASWSAGCSCWTM